MAMITIRNLDDVVKEQLRMRAARHGRSMEEEARHILKQAVGGITGAKLWERSRSLFKDEDGVDLELPARGGDRASPGFAES